MKTMKKLFGSLLSIFVLVTVVLFTISCEIGLGSSVDTDPPAVNIDATIVDTIISGDFDIEGTYKDDGIIKDVSAVLKRTDGTGTPISITGILEEDPKNRGSGIWKIPVNSKSEEIIDGSYQVTVSLEDSVGRVTSQSTTFTIDNTPPVLILTKPNSNPGDETISAYGQRVFLEGSIADTAKETYITVEFYDNAELTGTPLDTIKTGAIAPTDVNSNNAKLTIFKEDSYDKIYRASLPEKKEGSKDVYIKLVVEDIAGNKTEDFYFSKDLAKNLTKSSGENAFGLAPIDIYNVLNGTDALKSTSRAAGDVSRIKELLNENAKKKAMFTLNPDNSPYFTVSGMKTLTKSGTDFESKDNGYFVINGAQTLEISVFMGSDSIELVDDKDFYVYVLECDAKGDAVVEDKEENRIKLYSKSKESGSGIEKKTYYSIGGKQGHKTTAGAYVFTVPMSKSLRIDPDTNEFKTQNLEYGKNYVIRVSGKDNEDNPIEPNETGYGFHFSTGGGAPILNITEPTENTVFHKKGEGLLLEGSAKSDEGVPEITVWNGTTKIADIPLNSDTDGELNEFSYTIPKETFDQDNSKIYSLSIKATRGDAFTENKYSVWYDVEGPEIKINSIQPVVIANDKTNNINGNLKINGTIIDTFDQVGETTFKVYQNGSEVTAVGKAIESSFDFALDTTKLADKAVAILKIQAQDRVGNLSTWEREYYVDQSTDKPSLTSSEGSKNIDKGIGNEGLDFVEAGNNLFIRGGNLVLSVSDDDGVARARVTVQAYDKVTKTISLAEEKQDIIYDNSPAVISHTLPSDVGLYLATVSVYDNEFKSISETPNNYITKQFFLRVTGNGPDVSITPNHEYIKTGSTYILTFNITDEGNKPYKFKVNNVDERENINEDTFTYNYQPAASDRSVKFTILDKNNGFTDKVFQPKFDDILPEISITSNPDYAATGENSFLYKGTLSDLPSGVETVKIKFDDIANSQTTDWVNVESFSKSSWNYEVIWSGSEASAAFREVFAAENEKKVTVKAIDGAGNEKEAASTFIYDKKAPEVTLGAPSATDGKDNVGLSLTINDSNPEKIIITVTDSQGNVKDTINVTTFTGSTDLKMAGATILKEKLTADGDYTITAKGVDKNGRESTVKSAIIKRDTSAPTVVIKTPVDDSKINEKALEETTQFSIRLDDANGTGVTKVFYKFTDDAVPGEGGYTEDTGSNGPYTIDIPFIRADASAEDKAGKLEEGHWYLHIYAVDEANNESAPVTRRFDIDLTYPSLDVTIPESDTTKLKTDGIYYFNAALTGSITASDTSGSVTTTCSIDGASPVTLAAGSTWTLPASSFTDNAKHTLTFETKDGFNKATRKSFELYKDIAAPAIAVNPQGPVNSAPTLSGTVNDGAGVGATKIFWSKTGADASDFAELTYTAGTSNWTYPVVFAENEAETTKTYWFKAQDALGNVSASESVSFEYDKAPPTITFTGLSANAIYKNSKSFSIAGTANDSNKLKYVYIEKNGELIKTIATGDVQDYSWTHELTDIDDGNYTFKVYAEDAAGKKSQILSQEIIVDINAPTVDIINPANDNSKLTSALGTNTTFTGSVQDTVSGVDKVYCYIGKSAPTESTIFEEATIANGIWSYRPSNLAEDLGYKLYVYAIDKAKNSSKTTYVTREFDVDNANPTIASVTVEEQYNAEATSPFTVVVSASDTHGIADNGVIISWGSGENDPDTMTFESGVYKKSFAFGSAAAATGIPKLNDGNYTFTVTAKDKANKTVESTKAVMIDTQAPAIGTLKINGATLTDTWYGSKKLAVSVDVTDAVSTVQFVQYSLDSGSTWTDFYKQGATGNNYGGTVDFEGGTNTIKIKATDYAGNENNSWTAQTVKIDDTAAELTALYSQVGSNPVAEIASTLYVKKDDTNGTGAITIYGKYYDGESGLKEGLSFTIEGTTQTPSELKYTSETGAGSSPTATEIAAFTYGDFSSSAKYWKAVFIPTKEGSLTISGKNNADKTSSDSPSKIKIDDKPPVLSNISLSNAYKKDDTIFFVNNNKENNQEKTFTLEGVATDNYGLVDVTLSVSSGTNTITPANKKEVSDWEFDITNISAWTTSATATLTLKDIAGHVTTKDITINFDTTPPVKVVELDAKNKDLYFRIGKADNDDNEGVTTEGSVGKWNDTLDKDVGKKYEENSYGNDNTIQLRGFFEDGENGSGVKMIYYKVYDTWDGNTTLWPTTARTPMTNLTEVELEKLISDVGQANAIKPGAEEKRRVFYNVTKNATDPHGGTKFKTVGDYDQYFKTIESNFNASISGFSKPVNYLVFVVEDNVGNKQVVQTTVNNISYANFKMNVDNTPPEITSNATSIITTRSNTTYGAVPPVTITGTLTDNASGINENSFEITINGVVLPSENITQLNKTDSVGKEYAWEIEIPATIMAAVGKTSFSVMASVRDNAGTGNLKTDSIASISLDDIPPTLSFTSSGGIIKDSFAVSVHANDANGIDGNKVYYKLYNASETPSEMPSDTDSYVSLDSTKDLL